MTLGRECRVPSDVICGAATYLSEDIVLDVSGPTHYSCADDDDLVFLSPRHCGVVTALSKAVDLWLWMNRRRAAPRLPD